MLRRILHGLGLDGWHWRSVEAGRVDAYNEFVQMCDYQLAKLDEGRIRGTSEQLGGYRAAYYEMASKYSTRLDRVKRGRFHKGLMLWRKRDRAEVA